MLITSLFIVGIALIGFGVVSALRGRASDDASAGAANATVKGPAWLVTVISGAALCVTAAWLTTNQKATEAPPTPTTAAAFHATTETTVRPSLHAALDALHAKCADGEMLACDDLVTQAAEGSDYYRYGMACGGRSDVALWREQSGTCVQQLGLTG